MHMTLEADYAVRIVELLAASGEKNGRCKYCRTDARSAPILLENSSKAGSGWDHRVL